MEPISPELMQYLVEVAKYSTICVVVIAVCVTIVFAIAFYRSSPGQAKIFSDLMQRAGALQLVTVFSIIVGACFLTIIGRITSEGIVSILSGVAGYVLGGLQKTQQGRADEADG